jgi:hypothetical protein
MKAMQIGTGDYYKFFNTLKDSQDVVVMWQANAKSRERLIMETSVNFFTDNAATVNLSVPPGAMLLEGQQLFFYVSASKSMFKCELKEHKGSNLTVAYPSEIMLLEAHDVPPNFSLEGGNSDWRVRKFTKSGPESFSTLTRNKKFDDRSLRDQNFMKESFVASEDEEEEKYIELIAEGEKDSQPLHLLELNDKEFKFSTFFLDDFAIFSEIRVAGIGQFRLDEPIVGVVVSHRRLEKDGYAFEVGVKFLEEEN